MGRSDDVIKSSGWDRPFEVESALIERPAVINRNNGRSGRNQGPDSKGNGSSGKGYTPSEELKELQDHVKRLQHL